MSPLASWCLFGALIFGFFMWCLLMIASDADDVLEADERSWIDEDDDEG